MSVRRDFPDLPPVWALGIFGLQVALARLLPIATWEGGRWLATVLLATGFAFIVWSAVWFRRKRTPIEPRETPTALIVEGPYRVNRNPIYTGMALMLLGTGLASEALSALAAAALFPVVISRRFIAGEEAALRAAFGTTAERYFAATRRW